MVNLWVVPATPKVSQALDADAANALARLACDARELERASNGVTPAAPVIDAFARALRRAPRVDVGGWPYFYFALNRFTTRVVGQIPFPTSLQTLDVIRRFEQLLNDDLGELIVSRVDRESRRKAIRRLFGRRRQGRINRALR